MKASVPMGAAGRSLILIALVVWVLACGPAPTAAVKPQSATQPAAPAEPSEAEPTRTAEATSKAASEKDTPAPEAENRKPAKAKEAEPTTALEPARPSGLPAFVLALRSYGVDMDDFEYGRARELGMRYVQNHWSLFWESVEPRDDGWKWGWADQALETIAGYGLKIIPIVQTPKRVGLHWDENIERNDPRYAEEYGELAYELVNRYHDHPAWSGLVAVWGGSSDVWGEHWAGEPEVHVPLLNAAYDGIKAADPDTLVIGPNMATSWTSPQDWAQWMERAFALKPRFDWFGLQSHSVMPTYLESPESFAGVAGLPNVRAFLDAHGYADRPIFLNEGGYDLSSFSPTAAELEFQAQQAVQTFLVASTLEVELRGWVYFTAWYKEPLEPYGEDFGLMTPLSEADPPQPRPAWYALQTLLRTVGFYDYRFEGQLAGAVNAPEPWVLRYVRPGDPGDRLWVVFSPKVGKAEAVRTQVSIDIGPDARAAAISMLGEESLLSADASGRVAVQSTGSPVYIRVRP